MRRPETPISDGKATTATKREHDESAADVALNHAFRGGCPCRLAHAADGLDASATGSAASFIVILMTGVLSICGLARIVAGSVDTFYLVFPGEASMSDYIRRFFIPTHVGNVF